MNHARHFEKLILELQELIASSATHDVIDSSRILRQLFVDGDSLLHLVNRKLRAPPAIFRVCTLNNASAPTDWINLELFCLVDDHPYVELDLKEFLRHRIGVANGKEITVLQVIKYAAIVLGGVHFKVDKGGEYEAISRFHSGRDSNGLTPALVALRQIGAIARDALIPVRDLLIKRERFENGKGWTALLCIEILPSQPDEDNYILDLGTEEHKNRFSIYVDSRGELTFRVIDRNGSRRYLRAGRVGDTVPAQKPITIVCECSTVGDETLLSLRADGWDHAEIVESLAYQKLGDPFHFVTGSDCVGKKKTHMFMYGEVLIGRPLTKLERTQAAHHFASKADRARVGMHYQGSQFMYSVGHPNFDDRSNEH